MTLPIAGSRFSVSRPGGERDRFYMANKEPVVPLQDVLDTGAGVMVLREG